MIDENIFSDLDPDDVLLDNMYSSVESSCQSSYFTVEKFNREAPADDNSLSICNFNIRSYLSNCETFFDFISVLKIKFKVFVLTETRFSGSEGCPIESYNGCHSGRSQGGGGGVSVYCSDWLSIKKVEHLSINNNDVESCVVEIVDNSRKIFVLALYRPPQGSLTNFNEFILFALNDPILVDNECIVTGDLNINLLNYENSCVNSRNFIYNMFSLSFVPLITKPTRFPSGDQSGSPTLLDHMWYNRSGDMESGIFLFDCTDHLPTYVLINNFFLHHSHNFVKITFRDHSRFNVARFVENCVDFGEDIVYDNVENSTYIFCQKIDQIYCNSFPLKTKYISQKRFNKPWLNSDIMNSIKIKSRLYKNFKLGFISENYYKNFKNNLTKTIKKAKKSHYVSKFEEYKINVKMTWKIVNELVKGKKVNRSVSSIVVDGNEITDEKNIAEHFCEYFSNIACNLSSNIPPPINDPISNLTVRLSNSLFLSPVTPSEIISIVCSLKNSSYGIDSIPTKMFKIVINYLSLPLSILVNSSFCEGKFPSTLKKAIVTPILKSGSPSVLNNYRPISVLPLLSKIFEKCIAARLIDYMHKYEIVSTKQFGFQK